MSAAAAVWQSTRRVVSADRRVLVGAGILAVIILLAILAPIVAPHDPEQIDTARVLTGPSAAHPFGSDALGRDVLSRVIYAYRTSLGIAVGSVVVAFLVGSPIGLVAGYVGGWVDTVLMRPIDMLLSLPAMLLAISLIAVMGPGSLIALVAIALIFLPILARVVRSSVLVTSTNTYVAASRSRGAGALRVMRTHVLPNSLGPALIQASILMGFALQIEAALSFLGLGAQPPTPSLGLMLADGRNVLTQAPWAEVFPGLAIAVAVLAFMLIGDGLRSSLDAGGTDR